MTTPKKQQIDQAERLKAAGLCKNSNIYVMVSNKTHYEIATGFREADNLFQSGYDYYGPLPTFEEVWGEFEEQHTAWMRINEQSSKHPDITTAAIEALLLLKATSGKQILTEGE